MTRILITGARAPAALHLARLLDAGGHHIVMADSLVSPISAVSKACAAYVRLPAANGDHGLYAKALVAAVETHAIALVVPTCEEVFHLAALWDKHEIGAALYAPSLTVLVEAHNKFAFTQRAQALGLAVPATTLLKSDADVEAIQGQAETMVFKPVWSRFGTDARIRPRRAEITPTFEAPWVAQAFVAGEEVCAYAFAHQGRIAGVRAYRPVYRAGVGAGIAFAPDDDPAVTDYVRAYVKGTNWTGQIAFDFIRPADGPLQAIECNPRATSGLHFFRNSALFAGGFLGSGTVSPDVAGLLAVKAALPLYHPLTLFGDFWRADDVIDWPGDPRPARAQLSALWEMMRIARRHRISLIEATTHDIAWNGP